MSANAGLEQIDWGKGAGLVPAIIQHAHSGAVLMLGYMNREALQATLERGRVVFFSRTRQRLWEKGESSGHTLTLKEVRVDCDQDTLLVTALPAGPVCHAGTATCFGDESASAVERLGFLGELEGIVASRIGAAGDGSYTARLVASGIRRVSQKVGEEGLEVALAGASEDDPHLISESADLLYHLLVLLRARGLSLEQVVAELASRHASRSAPTAGTAS
jgi:phosphoribosyl-AMP cyclohydrolase / phosphoribosyl-ATP pyrophosphohydrolase